MIFQVRLRVYIVFLALSVSFQTYAQSSFRFGVINERTQMPEYALTQLSLLHRYLQTQLAPQNIIVEDMYIARNIEDMMMAIEYGKVHALFEGVLPTLVIKHSTKKITPSMIIWRKGQRQYHSVFFVRKDSPYQTLMDLAGKTIAFESKRSTSAYFLPLLSLKNAGLSLASVDDSVTSTKTLRYQFAGSELNQAYWVYYGKADTAAFNNGDWDRTPEKIRQHLRIIHSTRPLLRWLFSFTHAVSKQDQQKIMTVLLNAHKSAEGLKALQAASNIAKFEVLNDQDLENISYWNELIKTIK